MNAEQSGRDAVEFLKSSEAREYDPVSYLIEPSEPTSVHNVFRNGETTYLFDAKKPLIIDIFGPSGAGKDTITRLNDYSIGDVRIATSRQRREGEREEAYVWMGDKQSGESEEDYFSRLAQDNKLVTFAVENGILYGVPKEGIEKVDSPVVTVRMSARSIDMLRENLGDQYNIVSLMVVPDSFESLIPSILARGNVEKRLHEVVENMKLGRKYANYFLLNRHVTGDEAKTQEAIDSGRESFAQFIQMVRSE